MAKVWAVLLVALAATAASDARAGEPEPDSATAALCEDYKVLETAALDGFSAVGGKSSKLNPAIGLAPDLLAPRFSPATLTLPDARECDLRPSRLRRGKSAYSCFWRSEQPDLAAVDQAKQIAACLDARVSKGDFSPDLVVVTGSKVRFVLAVQHTYDNYGVRLLVDGPQF
jgi:hypothetical protein